jgi:hypothetical protein
MDLDENTKKYMIRKRFLTSFRDKLDLHGARYLMNNNNSNTIVELGDGTTSGNFRDNYGRMIAIKSAYKRNIEDEDFSEALKKDAKTQLAIIDDIENKFKNEGINDFSLGGKMKRKKTKRRSNKRRSNKRRSNKRRSNKRRH